MRYLLLSLLVFLVLTSESCNTSTAHEEQVLTETNQKQLNIVQPPPRITWSLERDNLIRRFKMMNDRSIVFYMYLFIEGVAEPIGYYQVNKVSSVNSQLTNTEQRIYSGTTLPSPSEDGSYGTNGDGVFGFTPEDIYIEHNLHYVVSSVPLKFKSNVAKLVNINLEDQKKLKILMDKLDKAN